MACACAWITLIVKGWGHHFLMYTTRAAASGASSMDYLLCRSQTQARIRRRLRLVGWWSRMRMRLVARRKASRNSPLCSICHVLAIYHSRPYARSTAFRTCIPALIRPRKYHISTFTGSRLYYMCLSENVGVHVPTCNMIYAHSLASLIRIALYPASECKW